MPARANEVFFGRSPETVALLLKQTLHISVWLQVPYVEGTPRVCFLALELIPCTFSIS